MTTTRHAARTKPRGFEQQFASALRPFRPAAHAKPGRAWPWLLAAIVAGTVLSVAGFTLAEQSLPSAPAPSGPVLAAGTVERAAAAVDGLAFSWGPEACAVVADARTAGVSAVLLGGLFVEHFGYGVELPAC